MEIQLNRSLHWKNILEQANDWRASLHTHVGDFEKSPRFGTRRKIVEHHGELWNTAQDGERGSGDIRRVWMRRNRRIWDIRQVQDLVRSKAGIRNVRILIPTGHGLDHEEDNSKTLRTEFVRNRERIVVNSQEVKDVEEFAYLGAIVEEKGGGSENIRNRMQKARGAFQRLWKDMKPGGSQRLFKENRTVFSTNA